MMAKRQPPRDNVPAKSRRDGRFQPATAVAGKRPNTNSSPGGTTEAERIKRAIIANNKSYFHLFEKLNRLGKRVAVPIYLDLMTHPDIGVVGEAAKAIPGCATAIHGCVRLLDRAYPETTRFFAAWALGNIADARAIGPLLDCARDDSDSVNVRSHAIEAIGMLLMIWGGCKRSAFRIPRGLRQRVIKTLIKCLADPSPDVRFWACYALGSMQAKSALEQLDKLAKNDRRRAKGFWSVAREARDAAQCIRQGFWPDL